MKPEIGTCRAHQSVQPNDTAASGQQRLTEACVIFYLVDAEVLNSVLGHESHTVSKLPPIHKIIDACLTPIFRTTSLQGGTLIELRMDDEGGGVNWSYETCKAPCKSSTPTYHRHPNIYRRPSCHPTNSVRALKGESITLHRLVHPKLIWQSSILS